MSTLSSDKSLFRTTLDVFKKLGRRVIDEVKIHHALESYVENYMKRYGHIKVLGMTQPIPVKDIYTSVEIISPRYRHAESTLDDLDDDFRSRREHNFGSKRLSGISAANENQKLNVLGPPGSGKSTFLKSLGMEAFKLNNIDSSNEFYEPSCIPVFIELKRFRNENVDLKKAIQNEFEVAGFPETSLFLDRALKDGMLLILLDGLDEVPKNLILPVIEHIRDFSDKYKGNRFITSCRTAFYKNFLVNFVDVEIASFDDSQIKTFIHNWFSAEKDLINDTPSKFEELLFQDKNIASLELARTPLLLTFLCLTFDESQRFPQNRSSLYRKALMILIEKWAAEKRIHQEDIYHDFSSELEIEMLAEIAAKFYIKDSIVFYENDLKNEMKLFMQNTFGVANVPISKVLEAIEVQQGILVQRASEIYSFSHLTIQEFLTAHFYNTPQKTPLLVKSKLLDPKWREVFLLLSGMCSTDDLLALIKIYLDEIVSNNEHLQLAFKWIDKILQKTEDYEGDLFKRVYTLSLLIRFKRYESKGFGHEPRLEDGSISVLRKLNKTLFDEVELRENFTRGDGIKIIDLFVKWRGLKIDYTSLKNKIELMKPEKPLGKMLNGGRHKYRRGLLMVVYDFLNVPEELTNLSKPECKAFVNYIDGVMLLLECKDSGLRVSIDNWQQLCKNLLTTGKRLPKREPASHK
jgi:hypothetical protein